jgi:cytochrome c biogenesis protein
MILMSIIGSLIPQAQEPGFYQKYFPRLAGLIIPLKLGHLYRSPLFLSLVFLFLLNLFFCTVKQLGAKIKRLSNESGFSAEFLSTFDEKKEGIKIPARIKSAPGLLTSGLQKKHYRVKIIDEKGQKIILARKGITALFGPEIVHLSLIIIIIGGLVTALLSFRTTIALSEGQAAKIPGKHFSLRLDRFNTEYYPDGSVKAWKSEVSVVEDNQVKRSGLIAVNHPFKYGGLRFYQMSYGQDWDSAEVELEVKTGDKIIGNIILKPGEISQIGDGLSLGIKSFVPDFQIDSSGQVISRSPEPSNPATLVEIEAEGEPVFSGWIFYLYPDFTRFHRKIRTDLEVSFKKFEAPVFSVLEASSDPGSTLVWAGSIFLMFGLLASFYMQPREVRILVEDSGHLRILFYARKNRQDFLREIEQLLEDLNDKNKKGKNR